MNNDLRATDIYGLSRLAVHAVAQTTDLVEQMHYTIGRISAPVGRAREGRTRGITGLVYRSIQGVTGLVGGSMELAFRNIVPLAEQTASSARREKLLAVINGVVGDHLEHTANPLAIPMRLHHRGQALTLEPNSLASVVSQPSSRLLIAVHGLCMSHQCWTPGPEGQAVDLPGSLANRHGYTDLHLHYNSGRPIASNGRELAKLMEKLLARWPVPVEEVILLGHSMGGLVSRSACHYGCESGHEWTRRVGRMIFLGSPHHGSPLERAGYGLERLMGVSPYSAPFQRLGRMRSAGITDLRHGRIIESSDQLDQGVYRDTDLRQPLLPAHVELHAIAATRAQRTDRLAARLVGDGLVPVASALGHHPDPARHLPIPAGHQRILPATSHIDLLYHPQVLETIDHWLS